MGLMAAASKEGWWYAVWRGTSNHSVSLFHHPQCGAIGCTGRQGECPVSSSSHAIHLESSENFRKWSCAGADCWPILSALTGSGSQWNRNCKRKISLPTICKHVQWALFIHPFMVLQVLCICKFQYLDAKLMASSLRGPPRGNWKALVVC